jgi:hypothetical protein
MPDAKAVAKTTQPVVFRSWRVLEGIYLRIVEGDGYNACWGTEKGKGDPTPFPHMLQLLF